MRRHGLPCLSFVFSFLDEVKTDNGHLLSKLEAALNKASKGALQYEYQMKDLEVHRLLRRRAFLGTKNYSSGPAIRKLKQFSSH